MCKLDGQQKNKHLPWQDTGDILSADNATCFVHTTNISVKW